MLRKQSTRRQKEVLKNLQRSPRFWSLRHLYRLYIETVHTLKMSLILTQKARETKPLSGYRSILDIPGMELHI